MNNYNNPSGSDDNPGTELSTFATVPPPSGGGVAYFKGWNFITIQEKYGNTVYDAYTRVKVANGDIGASLPSVKAISDQLMRHDWDMANVPFANIGSTLVSLVGDDLTVTGGGNGSRFDMNGLLVTGLPADRPRVTHDPASLEFQGVYLERESTNLISNSNNIDSWSFTGIKSVISSYASPSGGNSDGYDMYNNALVRVGVDSIIGNEYTASVWIKSNLNNILLGLRKIGQTPSSESIYTTLNWKRYSITANALNSINRFLIDSRIEGINYGAPGIILYVFNAQSEAGGLTSIIETTDTPLTRPADIYTAPALINTASDYSILKMINGETILQYIEPVAGTLKTYKDGVYIGQEAFTPVTDLVLSSEGSDLLSAVAYKSGTLTEQERLDRSVINL